MTSFNVRNNNPRHIALGIRDLSVPLPVRDPVPTAIHSPLLYLFTEKGIDTPFTVTANSLETLIGSETFNRRGQFYYHQTAIAEACLAAGNAIEVQRLRPLNARNSSKVLALAIRPTASSPGSTVEYFPYERDANTGAAVIDPVTGLKVLVEEDGTLTGGVQAIWAWFDRGLFARDEFGNAIDFDANPNLDPNDYDISDNVVFSADDDVFRPILDFKANEFGERGNNIGIRVWVAHEDTDNPADTETIETNRALVMNATIFRRSSPGATGTVVSDLTDESIMEFSFPIGAYNTVNDLDLSVDNFYNNYHDDGVSTGNTPVFGPVAPVQFYANNYLERVEVAITQANIAAAELDILGVAAETLDPAQPYLVDLMTGIDYTTGVEYSGIQILRDHEAVTAADIEAGLHPLLTESGTIKYLTAGSDGAYDAVNREYTVDFLGLGVDDPLGRDVGIGANAMASYLIEYVYMPAIVNDPSSFVRDLAKFPISAIYDSGFEFEAKFSLMAWMGIRPDVHFTMVTNVEGRQELTTAEEISVAATLTSRARLFPESTYHGTATVRNSLWAQVGDYITGNYRFRVPTVVEIASKRATYMGAGSGLMTAGRGYESGVNAHITTLKDISSGTMSIDNREDLWLGGANFAIPLDRTTYHWPAMQTTYPTASSVLTSELMSWVYGDLQRVAHRVWQDLTGNIRLTPEQLIQRSNQLILQAVNDKGNYDGLVTVVANTRTTPADQNREYSWTTDVEVYSNVMKTTNRFTINARRLSDLTT